MNVSNSSESHETWEEDSESQSRRLRERRLEMLQLGHDGDFIPGMCEVSPDLLFSEDDRL